MLKRLVPVILLILAMIFVYAFDLHRYLDLEALRENRERLAHLVAEQFVLTSGAFVALYAICVALSIPAGLILTLAGGFLFGTWIGGLLAVIGATTGAAALFLVAKTALGGLLKEKAGPWFGKIEKGFQEDGVSYLLILRLVPVFPFWLVNLVPAFLGVGLTTFTLTTFFGIMPGSFVYAAVGNGLGEIFELGGEPDLSIITKPSVIGPLLGLAAMACVPVIYKRMKRASQQSS